MEQIRVGRTPRASSTDDRNEWNITEDGFRFGIGDIVFDYYDCRWVTIKGDPTGEGDPWANGWFDLEESGTLNSTRVVATPPSWVGADKLGQTCCSITLAFGACILPDGHKTDCRNDQGEEWDPATL